MTRHRAISAAIISATFAVANLATSAAADWSRPIRPLALSEMPLDLATFMGNFTIVMSDQSKIVLEEPGLGGPVRMVASLTQLPPMALSGPVPPPGYAALFDDVCDLRAFTECEVLIGSVGDHGYVLRRTAEADYDKRFRLERRTGDHAIVVSVTAPWRAEQSSVLSDTATLIRQVGAYFDLPEIPLEDILQ